MIKFLKENGFPMTLILDTVEYNDKENEFNGFLTIINDDQENEIIKFTHTDLRARIHWVEGFFTAYKMFKKEPINLQ
jgi:hypothetical protein